jgi:hypothetical protein
LQRFRFTGKPALPTQIWLESLAQRFAAATSEYFIDVVADVYDR